MTDTTKLVPLEPTEEMINAVIAEMGPIVGHPERLADPAHMERTNASRRKAAIGYCKAVIAAAPSLAGKLPPAESCAGYASEYRHGFVEGWNRCRERMAVAALSRDDREHGEDGHSTGTL